MNFIFLKDRCCPICLEKMWIPAFQAARRVKKLACGHIFHSKCIKIVYKPQCPLCEYPIFNQNEEAILKCNDTSKITHFLQNYFDNGEFKNLYFHIIYSLKNSGTERALWQTKSQGPCPGGRSVAPWAAPQPRWRSRSAPAAQSVVGSVARKGKQTISGRRRRRYLKILTLAYKNCDFTDILAISLGNKFTGPGLTASDLEELIQNGRINWHKTFNGKNFFELAIEKTHNLSTINIILDKLPYSSLTQSNPQSGFIYPSFQKPSAPFEF